MFEDVSAVKEGSFSRESQHVRKWRTVDSVEIVLKVLRVMVGMLKLLGGR